jgi:hypothetical protein
VASSVILFTLKEAKIQNGSENNLFWKNTHLKEKL